MPSYFHGIASRCKARPLPFLVAAAVVAVLVFWGIARLMASPPEPDWVLATVTRGDIEDTIGSLGTLEPKEYVDVGTQVSGQLKQLLVDIGDPVEEGQLLAVIDPVVYESRVRSSRASLNNLRAQLSLQEAEQQLAQRRLERNRSLFRENAVSEDVLLASETEVAANAARIRALNAQIDAAEATLDGDLANLGYTEIYAPMSGTVVDASAIQGQTINATQTAPTIVRIAQLDVMTVRVEVSEADVVRIHEGMPVYFTTLGMPERRWHGEVRKVLPTPQIINNVVLYHVLVDVENPDGALMTSMTAQVFFVLAEARDTLVIPTSALRPLQDQAVAGGQRQRPAANAMPSAEEVERIMAQRRQGGESQLSPRDRERMMAMMEQGAAVQGPVSGSPGGMRHQVQVMTPEGPVWRPVRVGVASRTEASVLEGLKEGERVVAGRVAAGARTAGGPPMGMMGMGMGGRR